MIFLFYLLANASVTVFFFKFQKKNLHAIEIFISWVVSTIIFQNYVALFYMNFDFFYIPEILSLELAHLLNRTVLIPVITLLFLNHYILLNSLKKKLASFIIIVLFCTGLEWLDHVTGVVIHRDWKIWWSFSFWIFDFFICLLFLRFFRKKLTKAVQP